MSLFSPYIVPSQTFFFLRSVRFCLHLDGSSTVTATRYATRPTRTFQNRCRLQPSVPFSDPTVRTDWLLCKTPRPIRLVLGQRWSTLVVSIRKSLTDSGKSVIFDRFPKTCGARQISHTPRVAPSVSARSFSPDFTRVVRFRLLYSVLPISVATELRHERPVPPKRFECVTLLFSGIVGFSDYCAGHADSKGAMKIVRMLNQLYTAFDVLTDPKKNPNVYKVHLAYLDIFRGEVGLRHFLDVKFPNFQPYNRQYTPPRKSSRRCFGGGHPRRVNKYNTSLNISRPARGQSPACLTVTYRVTIIR